MPSIMCESFKSLGLLLQPNPDEEQEQEQEQEQERDPFLGGLSPRKNFVIYWELPSLLTNIKMCYK